MADEVDTLMHIRGSLQTTEGIDIVLEAGRLAELYNQASTVMGQEEGIESISRTTTHPTIDEQSAAETERKDKALVVKCIEIASRRTEANILMNEAEMQVAMQSYRTTVVARAVDSIHEQNKGTVDASRKLFGQKYKEAVKAHSTLMDNVEKVSKATELIAAALKRHSLTSGRDDEITRRDNVEKTYNKKMAWLHEMYRAIDNFQKKINESAAKELMYQTKTYIDEQSGATANPYDPMTATAEYNKWISRQDNWQLQIDKQCQQLTNAQMQHARGIADSKKDIALRYKVKDLSSPSFDYRWFKSGGDEHSGGAYNIAETIQARLNSDPGLHLMAVINQRKNDTYTNNRHYSPRELPGEDKIAEPTTKEMLRGVATDSSGIVSESMIEAILIQSENTYSMLMDTLPAVVKSALRVTPISIPKVPGDTEPTSIHQGLTNGDGLQLLDAIYRMYVAQDIYHTAQVMKQIQQAVKNLEEHNPMRYIEVTLSPLLQRAKKSMIKLPAYEMTPIISALKDRYKHDSCKPMMMIASDPKWTSLNTNSLDMLITMLNEIQQAYHNLQNQNTSISDWDNWWSKDERKSSRMQGKESHKRANGADRHYDEPSTKPRHEETVMAQYGAHQTGGWGNHRQDNQNGGWGSRRNDEEGKGWGQRRSRSRDRDDSKGKGKGKDKGKFGWGKQSNRYDRGRAGKDSYSSNDSGYQNGRGRSPSPRDDQRQRQRSASPYRGRDEHQPGNRRERGNHGKDGNNSGRGVKFTNSCKSCSQNATGRGFFKEYCAHHAKMEIDTEWNELHEDN